MTWVEVAGDAVKIGLGAVVGGIFATVAARQAHTIRQREEYSRRRRDQLERISDTFDAATHEAREYVARTLSSGGGEGSGKAKQPVATALGCDEVSNHQLITKVLHQLHSVEARLALLALPQISEEVEKFRHGVTLFFSGNASTNDAKREREDLVDLIDSQRTIIITLMAIAYRDA